MIRELRKVDINKVAEIWLDTNIKTHYFISAQYWKSNFELVKELLLQATVYVYEDKQEIQGFIGLSNEYIEGIFVSAEMQSQGIGKILLNYVKGKRNKLILNVYQKNTRAISFYQSLQVLRLRLYCLLSSVDIQICCRGTWISAVHLLCLGVLLHTSKRTQSA